MISIHLNEIDAERLRRAMKREATYARAMMREGVKSGNSAKVEGWRLHLVMVESVVEQLQKSVTKLPTKTDRGAYW